MRALPMPLPDWLAYALYLLWLLAGRLDFALHRRSDLPRTSGLRESAFHLAQLATMGTGVGTWLLLAPNRALVVLAALLALLHAWLGYLDTRSAYGIRRIVPAEQHVHSVLDIAPWVFLGLLAAAAWHAPGPLRWSPAAGSVLVAVLLPPLPLCVLPWWREWRACHRARTAAR